jgi:hypothetical protein
MPWMRRITILLFALPCISPTLRADEQVPDIFYSADSALPQWISEAEASRDGEPRWELFDEVAQRRLREKIAWHDARRPPAAEEAVDLDADEIRTRCVWIGAAGPGVPPPGTFKASDSLEDLVANARSIFVARVLDQKTGLLGAIPGTLYQIRVERVIGNSSEPPESADELLLFYPEAAVRFGDHYLCSTARRDFIKPSENLRVLVFDYDHHTVANSSILNPPAQNVLFELPSGQLAYPRRLRANLQETSRSGLLGHDETIEEFITAVERMVEHGAGK